MNFVGIWTVLVTSLLRLRDTMTKTDLILIGSRLTVLESELVTIMSGSTEEEGTA